MNSSQIRFRETVKPEDVENIREIAVSTGFFYDFEIPVAVELVEERLAKGEVSGYFFILAEVEGKTVSYSCYGPIAGTDAGYDLYWIVTHNDYRGLGIGKKLLDETHRVVKNAGGRYIIAETSSLEKYTPTRLFYEKNEYDKEAIIKDFYMPGDDKVVYVKRL
jgi:ribosomal protein S18 acetylase RimI-like enzyme